MDKKNIVEDLRVWMGPLGEGEARPRSEARSRRGGIERAPEAATCLPFLSDDRQAKQIAKRVTPIVIFINTLVVLSILFDGKNLAAEDNIKSSVSEQNSIVDQLLNHLETSPPEENPSKHFSLSNEINSFGLDNQNIAEQEQEYDDDALSSQEATIIPVLDLQNIDIQGAIDILNEKSVLNFSCEVDAKPYLQKPVDLYLENIKIVEALKIILEPRDLAFVLEKRTVRIMTSDAFFRRYKHPFAETMKTRIIPIHYRDVIKLGEDLSVLKGPEGKVFADNKTKAIVLLGTPDDLIKMGQFIAEQDIPLQTKVFLLENVTVKDIKDQV